MIPGLRTGVLLLGLLLAACAPSSPDRGIFLGDGTARATFDAHSDGAEPFTIEVAFPALADGTAQAGPHAGAVLLPASGIETSHYRWLARALAGQGYVVALVEAPHGLPTLDPQRAEVARQLLRSDRGLLKGLVSERIAVAGHAEGGDAAAQRAVGGGFSALVLLGSQGSGAALEKLGLPSLVVAGSSDCETTPAQSQQSFAQLPHPAFLAVVDGASHLEFTDDARNDTGSDCAPKLGVEDAHARILFAVQHFLDGVLRDDPDALSTLQAGTLGVSVEAK